MEQNKNKSFLNRIKSLLPLIITLGALFVMETQIRKRVEYQQDNTAHRLALFIVAPTITYFIIKFFTDKLVAQCKI